LLAQRAVDRRVERACSVRGGENSDGDDRRKLHNM
jgi:hypothetical protein